MIDDESGERLLGGDPGGERRSVLRSSGLSVIARRRVWT